MTISEFKGSYEFLSNFYKSPLVMGERVFTTVEHAYQAAKAETPEDFTYVASAATAAEAKKRGRKIVLRDDWEAAKFGVMRNLLAIKFEPKTMLAEMLLLTDPHELIEGNWWGDRIWGVCKGTGENWLGWLLMAQRAHLLALEAG